MRGNQQVALAAGRGAVEGYFLFAALWLLVGLWTGLLALLLNIGPFGFSIGSLDFFALHRSPGGFNFETQTGVALLGFVAIAVGAAWRVTRSQRRPA